MSFLIISNSAAQYIVNNRRFQSLAFPAAKNLVDTIKDIGRGVSEDPVLSYVFHKQNGFLFTKIKNEGPYLSIDLNETNITNYFSEDDTLLIFLKTVRLAIKLWNNYTLSVSEYSSSDNSDVIISFPIPKSKSTGYRLLLHKNPTKIIEYNKYLLVYHSSYEDHGELPTGLQVKQLIGALQQIPSAIGRLVHDDPARASDEKVINFHSLDDASFTPHTPFIDFDTWLCLLTKAQLDFVKGLVRGPECINGPAGTGKTLCMILKCINNLKISKNSNSENHSLFITHSKSTMENILSIFNAIDPDCFCKLDRYANSQTVEVITLQEWGIQYLSSQISESEYLDPDAYESKQMQLLYVLESIEEAISNDLGTYSKFMSAPLVELIKSADKWELAEMFAHELSVCVKGRAKEKLDVYKELPPLANGLPLVVEGDKNFVFRIYQLYKKRLEGISQFDTDDIAISALHQLDTPLWRRRRATEGYDSIFIDESHLFNINELAIFHHLTKTDNSYPIIFSVDKSQAIGDRGITKETLNCVILDGYKNREGATTITQVFRCSPQIVALAHSITASGTQLFDNFEDPLKEASSQFTEEEAQKCRNPSYTLLANDSEIIEKCFEIAKNISEELNCNKSRVAIVAFNPGLLLQAEKYGKEGKKPFEILRRRADITLIREAENTNRYILSAPDFVGGLDFDACILIGVDEGRVPPTASNTMADSKLFLQYASHNKLYVSITRARFRVEILGDNTRGISSILTHAIENNLIDVNP